PLAERGQRLRVSVFRASHQDRVAQPLVDEGSARACGSRAWTVWGGGRLQGSGLVYGSMPGLLTPENVVPRLRGRLGRPYRFVERAASTQRLLGPDDPEGAVAVADEQTEGRGRLGRRWEAVAGTSVLCSVQLRPAVGGTHFPELTVVGAEACAEAIRTVTGLEPARKHPNDL